MPIFCLLICVLALVVAVWFTIWQSRARGCVVLLVAPDMPNDRLEGGLRSGLAELLAEYETVLVYGGLGDEERVRIIARICAANRVEIIERKEALSLWRQDLAGFWRVSTRGVRRVR